jgi:hypothetical protein
MQLNTSYLLLVVDHIFQNINNWALWCIYIFRVDTGNHSGLNAAIQHGVNFSFTDNYFCLPVVHMLDIIPFGDRKRTQVRYYVYISAVSHLAGVAVSVLATGPKCCGFEPGQGDGFIRVIKICSTPSSRVGKKAGKSHVVRFYCKWEKSWSPKGMYRLNFNFLRQYPTAPEVSGDGQSALVVKLGVSPSWSRLLTGSHSLSSWDSTTGPRPQCWDSSLTPSQLPIYKLKSVQSKWQPMDHIQPKVTCNQAH